MKTKLQISLIATFTLWLCFYAQAQTPAKAIIPDPPQVNRTYCSTEAYMTPANIAIMNDTTGYIDMSNVHACVKLYFHVVRRSDGSGGQSVSNVNQAFQILKNDFRPHDILFDWNGTINYINNTTLYNNPNSSVFFNQHS